MALRTVKQQKADIQIFIIEMEIQEYIKRNKYQKASKSKINTHARANCELKPCNEKEEVSYFLFIYQNSKNVDKSHPENLLL